VFGEAALLAAMHLSVLRPGPATETGGVVIVESLADFIACIHHKRTVLNHRFTNGFSLQNKDARFVCSGFDLQLVVWVMVGVAPALASNKTAAMIRR
jgi:hypothetical protein